MEIHESMSTENESESVEIEGRLYNRLLALEMAQDISLLSEIAPDSWSLQDNSALRVMRSAALSFAEPVGHGYLVEPSALNDAGRELARIHGVPSGSKPNPSFVNVHLPIWNARELALLRPGHEAALRRLVAESSGIAPAWKYLNLGLLTDMESVIGRTIPKPGYFDQWKEWRASESESTTLSGSSQPGYPDELLQYVADGIEAAHDANPNSWSIYNIRGGMALSISGYTALYIANERGDILLSGSPDEPRYDDLAEFTQGPSIEQPVFRLLISRRSDLRWIVERHHGSFIEAVRILAATTKTVTPRRAEFQLHVLRYVEEQTGLPLPTPAYVDDKLSTSSLGAGALGDAGPDEDLRTIGITDVIRQALAAQGLRYDDDQVASFYTGLQTKGFVVLSGISGTGKSKIATGFVELLPSTNITQYEQQRIDASALRFKLSPSQTWVAISADQSAHFPPIPLSEEQHVQFDYKGRVWNGSVKLQILNLGNPTLYLALGEPLSDQLKADAQTGIVYANLQLNDAADQVERVTLTTTSSIKPSSGKEKSVSNHLFLSVRPDWRDSTSLLGYYNPLSASYEWTDFLTFILRAVQNYTGPAEDRIAWFVILDEMNLAHVEYYFADLLSVIESGRDADGWTSEPLRFSYPETLDDDEVPPREVKLPPNLYIIGTVNMDETTHAFSPKVLDRAFTIELTDVSFENYPPTVSEPSHEAALNEEQKQALLQRFSRDGRFARIDKVEIATFVEGNPEVRDWLQALNTRLATYRLHFGYRVFDEIVQYLANNETDAGIKPKDAFDQAVLMKVLPKFTGSRARLEDPLRAIWQWAVEPTPGGTPTVEPGSGPVFPRVADKVQLMLATLERDGFVSFG